MFREGFQQKALDALSWGGEGGGGRFLSRSRLMSMTLSTINFVESQWLNSVSKERLERVAYAYIIEHKKL